MSYSIRFNPTEDRLVIVLNDNPDVPRLALTRRQVVSLVQSLSHLDGLSTELYRRPTPPLQQTSARVGLVDEKKAARDKRSPVVEPESNQPEPPYTRVLVTRVSVVRTTEGASISLKYPMLIDDLSTEKSTVLRIELKGDEVKAFNHVLTELSSKAEWDLDVACSRRPLPGVPTKQSAKLN